MDQQELNRLRDLVKMEQESKELVKLPYRSYRELISRLVGNVKFGGALENTLTLTYLGMVKDLLIALLRARLLKILDQASEGNVPRGNLMVEETKLVSVLEDLERLLKPSALKAPSRVMIVRFTSSYFSIKTSKGSMINEPTVGDLVILPKEDAIELVTNFKVAKAYRIKVRGRSP
ncbi:hypothetical protein Cmaq_0547 [Caldivirga maquilingensis IC-167]|uniref:GINS subunit domain-containing protein n=2 Tax=Caldivirga maquilingensis TaxID=76887 RepID=A8MC84_CALMQ|nr:hypothetical protein Cmaq_0547 [Caldivirga maquilingensis IC-167]